VERERRYPSDLTDAQWELIEVMLPLPKWIGRPELHSRRAIVDGIPVRGPYRMLLAAVACRLPALANGLRAFRAVGSPWSY
jgi:transposase